MATWEPIVFTLAIIVFGSLWVVRIIEDERLDLLKAFFFLYAMLNIFFAGMLLIPIVSVGDPTGNMTGLAIAYGTMSALFIMMTAWIYGWYLFERFFDKTQKIANGRNMK